MRREIDQLRSHEPGSPTDGAEMVDRRLASFEKSIQKKLDKLASRITTEATQRLEGHARAQQRLDEQKQILKLALDEIGSRIEEGTTSLATQLHGQSRLMSDSIRRTAEQLSEHFEREFEMKSWARDDRRALAKVVHELAMQLENDKA
jgi:exonuclease VII large subunit